VETRDRDVLESDLALVSSSHPDNIVTVRTYQMQATLFPALFALVDSLEDEIGLLGLVNSYHLHLEGLTSCDHPGEWYFADLALKLGEVIGDNHACDFLFDLTVYPHLQALHMNPLA
jgi:hypothetical protein